MADTINLSDGVGVGDVITTDVEIWLLEGVGIGDVLNYVYKFLHLAKRIFTLRLRT